MTQHFQNPPCATAVGAVAGVGCSGAVGVVSSAGTPELARARYHVSLPPCPRGRSGCAEWSGTALVEFFFVV